MFPSTYYILSYSKSQTRKQYFLSLLLKFSNKEMKKIILKDSFYFIHFYLFVLSQIFKIFKWIDERFFSSPLVQAFSHPSWRIKVSFSFFFCYFLKYSFQQIFFLFISFKYYFLFFLKEFFAHLYLFIFIKSKVLLLINCDYLFMRKKNILNKRLIQNFKGYSLK